MKNIIKYIIPAVAAMLSLSACEDHRSDFLDEFQTILYFRNGGLHDLTLYRTGEDGIYAIPVCKTGSDQKAVTSAYVKPFDEAMIEEYNEYNQTEYTLVPAEYYKFVDENLKEFANQENVRIDFTAEDAFRVVNIDINTTELNTLMAENPEKDYIFAFKLSSESQVTEALSEILMDPIVSIPILSFKTNGIESFSLSSESEAVVTYNNNVVLNIDKNDWDFTCNLEVQDEAWLAEYNAAEGTSYELLPAEAYTLSTNELVFTPGQLEVPFEVSVERDKMNLLTEYVVPLKIASCSKEQFEIDGQSDTYLCNVRLDPDKVTLTSEMIKITNIQGNDGKGIPGLVDGDISTYWHSQYGRPLDDSDPNYGVCVDITLDSPLSILVFKYCTRLQNANGAPRRVKIGVSNDGVNWEEAGDFETEEVLTAGKGTWVTLPVIKRESSFTHIRFGIARSAAGDLTKNGVKCFTSLSEIEIAGMK
ncbi:MAG: DUF1735 domain-containing protein [Bacteroidales bacterium]|nr:DUF1735 domain-containing protein [Bacteroidales bacterium]